VLWSLAILAISIHCVAKCAFIPFYSYLQNNKLTKHICMLDAKTLLDFNTFRQWWIYVFQIPKGKLLTLVIISIEDHNSVPSLHSIYQIRNYYMPAISISIQGIIKLLFNLDAYRPWQDFTLYIKILCRWNFFSYNSFLRNHWILDNFSQTGYEQTFVLF